MKADPSLRFRQLVDHALTHLTWHEEVVRKLGVEGISQIWDDLPAWYVWLDGRAFLLRYPGLEENAGELTAILHAFPTREELERCAFSAEERRLLEPEHFDRETMTPRFESFARFADAFIIGEITINTGISGLDSLVVSSYRQQWETAWSFTDFFVALQSFYSHSAPVADPFGFSLQADVNSVLIVFEQHAAEEFSRALEGLSLRRLPYPARWRQLAHNEERCSAFGTCSCSH